MQICYVVPCQRPSHHWHWLHADVILIEKPKSNTKEKEKRWKYNWIWSSILQESPARLSIYHRWALLKNPRTCDALIKALVFGVETYNWSMCLQHYQGILIITSLLITQTSLRLGTGIELRDPSNNVLTATWRSTWHLTSHPEQSLRIPYTSAWWFVPVLNLGTRCKWPPDSPKYSTHLYGSYEPARNDGIGSVSSC